MGQVQIGEKATYFSERKIGRHQYFHYLVSIAPQDTELVGLIQARKVEPVSHPLEISTMMVLTT